MTTEKLNSHPEARENNPSKSEDYPEFDPENARRLQDEAKNADQEAGEKVSERFEVDPADYPIFSQQAGVRENEVTNKQESKTLSINETLGLMVGRTAELISAINGEDERMPKIDHVVYLDKSARPVSWLVDEFWDEFADDERPEKSFLAIDRRPWFDRVGIELIGHEEIREPDGTLRPAVGSDFWKKYDEMPEETRKDWLARIRALYIEDGIDNEDPDKILDTPTVLDGKHILVVDEVSRTGSTLSIAEGLLRKAIPEIASVNGKVFWSDVTTINDNGDQQMGHAPAWYPADQTDWRGRGVKDIDPDYYREKYMETPNKKTMAENYGSFVLGVPLENWEDEPGEPSRKLNEEVKRMHRDYKEGHILPNIPTTMGSVSMRIMDEMEKYGVEFIPQDKAKNNPNAYINLLKKRNK